MSPRRVPKLMTMVAIGALGLLAACAQTTDGSTTTMASELIDPGLQPYIDIAVADLAQHLSVEASGITVDSATLVEWPDSSLGCPLPGMQYAQMATDGAKIILTADGKQYSYHAGGSRKPFLCDKPAKSPPTTG